MHRAFLVFHRWLALVASAFILVIALSGALLTLEGPVARARAPHVTPTGPPLSLETVVARAQAASGGGVAEFVGMSDAPEVAWSVVLLSGGQGRRPVQVTINQYTGAIIHTPAQPDAAVAFLREVHLLHTRLLSGATGATVVVCVTMAALVLVITGLVVWWRDKIWRVRLTASWKRINFDLHHSVGVIGAAIALVITATGSWVHFDGIDNLMRTLNRSPAPTAPPAQHPATPGTPVMSLESIALVARAAVPDAAIMNIQVPPSPTAPAMVQLKYPEDHTPSGRSRVWIESEPCVDRQVPGRRPPRDEHPDRAARAAPDQHQAIAPHRRHFRISNAGPVGTRVRHARDAGCDGSVDVVECAACTPSEPPSTR
jgi:uncharacterized iron-regulated membrane protein